MEMLEPEYNINLFLARNGNKFSPEHIAIVRDRLEVMDDTRMAVSLMQSYQDPTIVMIMSLFFGWLGVDRFMVGDIGLGILKLLTCGAGGIWHIADWFFIMQRVREINFQKFMQIAY